MLVKLWADSLVNGEKTWAEVPAKRKVAVKAELEKRVEAGTITQEQYEAIVGE